MTTVVAIELLSACQAVDFVGPDCLTAAMRQVHAIVRKRVPCLQGDRSPTPDIEAIRGLIENGAFREFAPCRSSLG